MKRRLSHQVLLPIFVVAVTVVPVAANQPPVLHSIGPKTAVVGLQLTFEVSASSPDTSPPFLLPPGNMPAGATFNGFVSDSNVQTGTFRWTPDSTQVYIHYVTFYAWYNGLYDSETVAIDVKESGFDPGIPDTVELVVVKRPDAAQNQLNVELELYVFSDSTVVGSSAGFFWDNPNLQMDSAVATALADSSFGFGPWFYEKDSINITNDSQRFIFGGAYLPSDSAYGVPGDPSGRRLWATYYFTLSSWSAADSIVIDSTLVPPSNQLLFSVLDPYLGQIPFVPHWKGKVVIKDATDVDVINNPNLPQEFSLSQNYPNPFNPVTEITFDIPVRSRVTLTIYNVLGQKVTTLVDQELSANRYVVDWDSSSDAGRKVASGVYFYRLQAGEFVETKKMMLLK